MFICDMTKNTIWTDNGPKIEYNFVFNFSSKKEYLEQRAGWRSEYAELSQRIRQHKHWRKEKNRPEDMPDWKNLNTLWTLRTQANMMMQMRMQAKALSIKLMMEQKQAA